jgi:hypothetical protein
MSSISITICFFPRHISHFIGCQLDDPKTDPIQQQHQQQQLNMVNRPAFVENLSIHIPAAPTDDEIMEWFAAEEAHREHEESLQRQQSEASFLTRGWSTFASLSRDLETTVHHVAHWMMLWSQGHYLGQMLTVAATISEDATEVSSAPPTKEFSIMIVGIVLVALGIIGSGFVVATEFEPLCRFLGIHHNGFEANTVRRWCMLLSGSCSFMFAAMLAINTVVFPVVPSVERSDAGYFFLFRATGVLWGIVSGFLWFSLAHRELKNTKTKEWRWSAFDVCTLNNDGEAQPTTSCIAA